MNNNKDNNTQIVSFSGGRTSAYMCHLLKTMDLDLEFIFIDTGAEHPKTYEFVRQCDKHFDLNLKVLRPVTNPEMGVGMSYHVTTSENIGWDMSIMGDLTKKYGTFSALTALCTSKLKGEVAKKYAKANNIDLQWLGIRIDEPKRLKPKDGYKYLADVSDFEKDDVLDFWEQMPFDLEIPQHLGNCVFCVKKGINLIALAQRDEPELSKQWIEMIEQSRQRGDIDKRIMYRSKLTAGGVAKFYERYSYDEIKQSIRAYKDLDNECSESCEAFQLDLFKDN